MKSSAWLDIMADGRAIVADASKRGVRLKLRDALKAYEAYCEETWGASHVGLDWDRGPHKTPYEKVKKWL